ncbi:MAG: hypothetical protein CMH78_06345 [Nitrospinae bacterium]|nr:hypothetical protein [Nitrospinota bacterium]
MAKASARHILVNTAEKCKELMSQIKEGADFAELAGSQSSCPSGKKGGDLGEFLPGQMVPEFDEVVFSAELGKVHGPIKTDFGFHLIEITSRTEDAETKETTKIGKGLTTGSFHEEKQEETEEETEPDASLISTANEFLGEKPRYGWDKTDENFCETIFNIAKAVKGLGCKDFFFLQPLSVDHGLVNSYMDHLITIENLIKIFKETGDTKNKKQGAEEIFLRLRTVMMEIREKIIDPIQKDVNGKNLKTFTEYVDKWNSTINDVLEVDKAWGNQYEYGKPLKVDLPAVEEKSK